MLAEDQASFEPLDDPAVAREQWERLSAGDENPFASWMFAEVWWRHLGTGGPLRPFAVHDKAEIRALLPVYERGGVLRLVGHGDYDRLGPISAEDDRPWALRMLGRLASDFGRPLVADDLPAGSARWLSGTVVRRTQSPVVDLPPGGFGALLANRPRTLRQRVGNRERRLQRAHQLTIRQADGETLTDDLDTLMSLHNARWGGTSWVFSGARVAMHRELAERALKRGWLRLRVLELDGWPVAANYGFRVGGTECFYQTGRDPDLARTSCGAVLQAACIRAACEEGASQYRMLRGDEPYKLSWADRDAPVETVRVEPA